MTERRRIVSVLYGVGSAVIVGLIGPLYGALILILSFPLVFRRAANASVEWLLTAFAVSWVAVLAARPPLIDNAPADVSPLWIGTGVVPLVIAALLAIRPLWRRQRSSN